MTPQGAAVGGTGSGRVVRHAIVRLFLGMDLLGGAEQQRRELEGSLRRGQHEPPLSARACARTRHGSPEPHDAVQSCPPSRPAPRSRRRSAPLPLPATSGSDAPGRAPVETPDRTPWRNPIPVITAAQCRLQPVAGKGAKNTACGVIKAITET